MIDVHAMNLARWLLIACVSLLALAFDPSATAQVSARQDYANTIANARETAWKAINSGQGAG